jgi:uracil-DNA glycosylase family protein
MPPVILVMHQNHYEEANQPRGRSANAGQTNDSSAACRGGRVQSLRSLEAGNADGFWRRPANSPHHYGGEQPGDKEDIVGRPFVGPAGAVLDKALTAAGIERQDVYVTNIVKHFKWELRGKRRIHKKPNISEISACRPWLEAEIKAVKPQIVVLLGATAAQGILGRDFRVTQHRGEWLSSAIAPNVMATVHPSSILRAPDEDARHAEMNKFIADLKQVAVLLQRQKAA